MNRDPSDGGPGGRPAGFVPTPSTAVKTLLIAAFVLANLAVVPQRARAEYRAYELEVTDVLDCKLNKRDKCRSAHVTSSMSPDLYQQTNGGEGRIGVQMLATWMCYGDTSGYREVCDRPPTRNGKFNPGDDVRIALKKHITEGWRGKVEVAYYQADLGSNIYGVRFPDRQNAYLRYFERDLERIAGAPGTAPTPLAPASTEQPAAAPTPPGAPTAPVTPGATAAPATPAAPAPTVPATPGAPATQGTQGAPAPAAQPGTTGTQPPAPGAQATGAAPSGAAQPAPAGAPRGPANAPAAPAPPAPPGAAAAPAAPAAPAVPAPAAPPGPRAEPPR